VSTLQYSKIGNRIETIENIVLDGMTRELAQPGLAVELRMRASHYQA
jgi:hypothetical protein